MGLRFGLQKSYIDTLKQDVVPEGGLALAGGAVGGLAFGMVQNTKFFKELLVSDPAVIADAKKVDMRNTAKKVGLALLLGVGGGSALWMAGPHGVNAAKGLMGAMGATMTAVIWNHMAADKPESKYELQGTHVYQGELPAGITQGRLAGTTVRSAREQRMAISPSLASVLGA